MSDTKDTIESMIKGGVLGALIGTLIAEDKEEGAIFGALLGAAIAATAKASEDAKKTKVPLLIEENGKLYEIGSGGEKRLIKQLNRSKGKLPEKFKLT